jgi:cation diffusion facilitator CzcD-associated flavoprotein CzcO
MTQRDLRVVVIGAGMAGILAGIKLKQQGYREVRLYEKADRIGGTWRENTYPGLFCDVPSHHYTFTFERNPQWSQYLAPGPEIQAYFEQTTKKYDIEPLIRFNSEVTSARFEDGRWHLQLGDGRTDEADVVIAATGVLHHPRYPEIPGMGDFAGELFHTARWNHAVDLEDKRVGIIGMGSTGVQIVSALAGRVQSLEHFVRNPQWIMPTENIPYSDAQRAVFSEDPEALLRAMNIEEYTARVEAWTECLTDADSQGARYFRSTCIANLEKGIADANLREQLRPDHEPMCKRLIFSPDYYQAIQRPGTSLVRSDIEGIEQHGIRTANGRLHKLDVIALATGFKADQFMRPMKVIGRDGVDLEFLWKKRPCAYLAISMPDFPNFFMLNGPNGPVGNFSLIDIAEHQWRYIEQLMDRLREGGLTQISPTYTAMESFNEARIAAAKKTIWYTGGCQSWYLDAEGVPASWPWNYSRFVAEMQEPRWEAFELRA